jgi:hypothetical protein
MTRATPWRSGPGHRVVAILGIALFALLAGACTALPTTTYPPVGVTAPPAGAAAEATAREAILALGAAGLPTSPADSTYRPPEGPAFAAAPRMVLQARLPDDPDHGFIVVYEFASPAVATAAATEQAAYIASGPGRVQFVPDTRYVLRTLGSTAVFYFWSPGSVTDARAADVATALETLGQAVPIPQ